QRNPRISGRRLDRSADGAKSGRGPSQEVWTVNDNKEHRRTAKDLTGKERQPVCIVAADAGAAAAAAPGGGDGGYFSRPDGTDGVIGADLLVTARVGSLNGSDDSGGGAFGVAGGGDRSIPVISECDPWVNQSGSDPWVCHG
ncbi:hypothetical protein Vafri_13227, partial [Volvox africanus]